MTGCGSSVKVYQTLNKADIPHKVAILPFTVNETILEEDRPHEILRFVFFNYFSYLGYADMPLNEVDRKLNAAGMTPSELEKLAPHELRDLLGVDAVIKGHVLDANNFTGGIYAETRIHAKLEMIDLHTGKTMWDTEHHELNTSILKSTVVNIIKDQFDHSNVYQAFYNAAEEFSIKTIKNVPDPADQWFADVDPPKITQVEANLQPNQKLNQNDLVLVSLTGQAGLAAFFDIGNLITRIPMQEISPGHYTGFYQIKEKDLITDALIIACLKNPAGLTSRKVYTRAMVTTGHQVKQRHTNL